MGVLVGVLDRVTDAVKVRGAVLADFEVGEAGGGLVAVAGGG